MLIIIVDWWIVDLIFRENHKQETQMWQFFSILEKIIKNSYLTVYLNFVKKFPKFQ